jgi:small subunit ribosomal protein S4e
MRIPIARKGTKYVARALSSKDNSVPLVIAVRDMLKLARTAKEVQKMIYEKMLKINGREAKDYRESICLFNLLEAGKTYALALDAHGRFIFEEPKNKTERPCKVINKKLLSKKKIQLNLHDGTNILASNEIKTGDTVYLSLDGKLKSHVKLEKGKPCFVISGKYSGMKGKVEKVDEKGVHVHLENKIETVLPKGSVMVL